MASNPDDKSAAGSSGQMLTFLLGGESYGVDILRVKEIRGWSPVTRVPYSPAHMLGVLNLRGAIVPIIDLRQRFELPAEFSPVTVIIVLSLHVEEGLRDCGVVVDAVSDVVDVPVNDIKPAPTLNNEGNQEFISGIATIDSKMLIVLNVDDLLARDLRAQSVQNAA
jgi:purine-binding chemotaxis protein CheW